MASPRHRVTVLALVVVCIAAGTLWAVPQEAPGADAAGAATHRPRRNLGPSPIRLSAPDTSVALLSLVPAAIAVPCTYTGNGRLAFSLLAGPAGMTVDAEVGTVRWTPPAAAEGTEPAVRVRAGDGASSAEVAFTVRVATSQPVSKSLVGSTLTVTQPGTLNGLAFTFPAQTSVPPGQVTVSTVSAGQAPPLPPDVTRVSDFFRTSPVQGTADVITVTLPTTGLPPGRKPEELRLFVHSDAAQDAESGGDVSGPDWIRTWYALDVLPSGKVTIQIQGLGELSFIGLDPPVTPVFSPLSPRAATFRVGGNAVTTACVSLLHSNFTVDLNRTLCVVDYAVGKSFTVTVKNFGNFHPNPAASLDDLLGWLAAGRTAFDGYGLQSDPSFEVVVEAMPPNHPSALGFVTTRNLENRRVLHLTKSQKSRSELQGTAVHEYFHHAQARTTSPGKTNAIETADANWVIEGLARWVEDEVFDALNTYTLKESVPVTRILGSGVAAIDDSSTGSRRSYRRWPFWKMVSRRCPGFTLSEILNIDRAADPRGIVNFKVSLESLGWRCDFGLGFGEANRGTLANALLSYSYATDKENNLSLLDANEAKTPFERPGDRVTPSSECTSWDTCPRRSSIADTVRPAGVDTYLIDAATGLLPSQSVEVTIESVPAGRELWAWFGDNETPGGLANGAWYRSTGTIKHTYSGGSRAPETILFVVNADPAQDVSYRARAAIVNTFLVFSQAPTWSPGSPDADHKLFGWNLRPWPASYRLVWTFGDGSAPVTVDNAFNVTHRWSAVGDYPVTASLYSLPGVTLVAVAEATARIRYFHGDFQMSRFSGSSSGCFWQEGTYPNYYAKMAANPAATEFWVSFGGPTREDPEGVYLYYAPPDNDTEKLWVGSDDPAMTAADCPHVLAVSGNTLTARYANGVWGNGVAATCIEVIATQSGSHIGGTITHRDTAYRQVSGGAWQLVCRGDAVYTFTGALTGP